MEQLLDQLNPRQREAAEHTEGPLLILAGAGSGKTRVITYRIAHLLQRGVSPWNIMAITFTNKAAAEMRERLEHLTSAAVNDLWVRTFHSSCVRILRRDIKKLGYAQDFSIYDTTDQKSLIKTCIKELHLEEKLFPPKIVISQISSAKNELIDPDEYKKIYSGNPNMLITGQIYDMYVKRMRANNAVDFDDLILLTVRLFREHPEALAFYQNKFRYILVDEYQDTNTAQYMLIKLLASKLRNLCVVGDDDQSIYKFRGADISNILNFEQDFPGAKSVKLEQNYRSTQTILDAANYVIKNNQGRKAKKLWTENNEGEKITLYEAGDERDEARFIVDEIERLSSLEPQKYSDFAILYRTNAQSRTLEEQLMRGAVPYRVLSGLRFYDRKEIKDILAYLRILMNPGDNLSLRRIINEPARGIGNVTQDRAEQIADSLGISMYELLRAADKHPELSRAAAKLTAFHQMIEGLRQEIEQKSVSDIVKLTLERTGYLSTLEARRDDPEMESRIENLKEFVSGAAEFEKTGEETTFRAFLDNVSLVSDIDNYDGDVDSVSLMTMHTAKGLEFPVVFISGMEENIFPGSKAMLDMEDMEEERRLCYVGITRARQRLYLTYAHMRMLYGETRFNPVSRFVVEIPSVLVDDMTAHSAAKIGKPEHKPDFVDKGAFNINDKGAFNVNGKGAFSASGKGAFNVNGKGTFSASGVKTAMTKKTATRADLDLKPGDRVTHKKFGPGMILVAQPVGNDVRLEVAFETVGVKNLLAAYANLTKI